MTDEQFKQLMDKLEEIKRAQGPVVYVGSPGYPAPQYPKPLTQPGQYWDGLPPDWRTTVRD